MEFPARPHCSVNKTVSRTPQAPLQVFIPNILVPQAALARLPAQRLNQTFHGLPAGLLQAMARSRTPQYQSAGQLDRVESWLLGYLDPKADTKFDQYPAWAMLNSAVQGHDDVDVTPFTRFWATVGALEIERDGVRFTPADVLGVDESDMKAFWAVVNPLLAAHGWRHLTDANFHTLLTNPVPVPMEQASPWSVQGIRLTDYLPMSADCADWRRMWLNMQVELHNAPFNQAREAKGLKPLNALWFWGGGQSWESLEPMPLIKSVGADEVFDVVTTQTMQTDDEVLARFVFWAQRMENLRPEGLTLGKPGCLYCVNFQGWGSSTEVFTRLEKQVLQPMRLAGLSFDWVLLGQQGWKALQSNWLNRFKFWKHSPDWQVLAEPEPQDAVSEEDMQAAWQQGQREQDQIMAQWEDR